MILSAFYYWFYTKAKFEITIKFVDKLFHESDVKFVLNNVLYSGKSEYL